MQIDLSTIKNIDINWNRRVHLKFLSSSLAPELIPRHDIGFNSRYQNLVSESDYPTPSTPPHSITQTLADSSTTAETIFAIGLTRLFTRQVVRNGNRVRQKFYGPGKCLIIMTFIFWMSIFETLLVIKSNNENLHFLGNLNKKYE